MLTNLLFFIILFFLRFQRKWSEKFKKMDIQKKISYFFEAFK